MRPGKLTPEISQSQRMRRKAATFARHRLRVLQLLAGKPEGETVRHFRDRLILGTPKVRAVLRSLLDDGLIVPARFDKHERKETGYRIWGFPQITGLSSPAGRDHFFDIRGHVVPARENRARRCEI
jgi:hypothetical protein